MESSYNGPYEQQLSPYSRIVGEQLRPYLSMEQCDAIAELPYPESLALAKERLRRIGVDPEEIFKYLET